MKTPRDRWVLAVGVVVLLALLLFWFHRSFGANSAQRSDPVPPQTAPAQQSASLSPPEPPLTQKPSKGLLETFKKLNHNSIEFYGRAVDQDGEAVAWADVEASVLVNTGTSGGVRKARTTTDRQGYFSFTELEGQDLTMVISKPGYEFSTRTKLFSYTYFEADHKRHIPDPQNPVVFVMWRKQGAEPLLHYESTFWDMPADGSPIGIDLEKGKISKVGPDLVVRMRRDDGPSLVGGFGWSAQIEATAGGLLIAPESDFYNVAPPEGYQSHIDIIQLSRRELDAESPNERKPWEGDREILLWVRIHDGREFGRVRIVLYIPAEKLPDGSFKPRSIEIEAWINPSGSRNLEYEYGKEIRPPR